MGEYNSAHSARTTGRRPTFLALVLWLAVLVTQTELWPEYQEASTAILLALVVYGLLRVSNAIETAGRANTMTTRPDRESVRT